MSVAAGPLCGRARVGGGDGCRPQELPERLGGALAGIAERVNSGELALPLLLVNGNPRVSGYFDLHLIQESVQAEIEMAAQ